MLTEEQRWLHVLLCSCILNICGSADKRLNMLTSFCVIATCQSDVIP